MTKTRKPRTKKAVPDATETAESGPAPTPAKTGRGRRKASPTQETVTPQHTPKELELREKYPHQDILPQSYRVAGAEDRPGWGHKHTVLVKCATDDCPSEPRCIATSDLQWTTTRYCLTCAKHIKSNRRRTREVKKAL